MRTAYRNQVINVKRTVNNVALLWLLVFCLGFAAHAAADRFDAGLLWKIEVSGAAPSYLFGTMHSEDPDVTRLPDVVRQAFDTATGVTLEVDMDARALFAMAAASMLTDGTTLETHVGPQLYQRAVEAMAAQGKPEIVVALMKPWAVALSLMMPRSETGLFLDFVLYQQALADGKAVTGLETAGEQMDVFESMDKRDQIALLEDALDNQAAIQDMLVALKQAYLARDLGRMVEISNSSMRDSSDTLRERFQQRLLVDRNHLMAERMQAQLRRGGEFVAVGALHLPGEEGLLNLLSRQGFRVSRLY